MANRRSLETFNVQIIHIAKRRALETEDEVKIHTEQDSICTAKKRGRNANENLNNKL